jgi:hypothetical protein
VQKINFRISSEEYLAVGAIVMICAPGLIGYQCWHWLKYGEWLSFNILSVFAWAGVPVPHSNWIGVGKILSFSFKCPLSVAIFGLGWIIAWFAEIESQREKEMKRAAN